MPQLGDKKLDLLRRFRPSANGTVAHDHLGDIFAALDAQAFQRRFVAWVSALTNTPAEIIAIDGKTSRRSYQKKGAKEPIHTISAAARQRLVMEQVVVAEKSNEIVAIPPLLDMMAIEGAVATIDAMGCQRAIAKKIKDEKGIASSRSKTIKESHDRPGLEGVVMVESQHEVNGKITQETRFYIASLMLSADLIGAMIRDHRAIENRLHWVMDMVFRDDECRVQTENAPANVAVLKHMANNLIRRAPGKDFLRLERMAAAWGDDFLASLAVA